MKYAAVNRICEEREGVVQFTISTQIEMYF